MKILVTGSSGHLGEAIVRSLTAKDIECVGIDVKDSAYTSMVGSIADKKFVRKCMRNVSNVIHTATLHKPHVVTHSYQEFVDTNITGTLNLLEYARLQQVSSFIFTSTTSAFGQSLAPDIDQPAIWVTEETRSIPKNIYGVTKTAAEDICQLFFMKFGLPVLVLRTSRFFPEEDDNKKTRDQYDQINLKVNEFLNRRVDIEDVVNAHQLAMEKAPKIGFSKYIISATTPFLPEHLGSIRTEASDIIEELFPDCRGIYQKRNWKLPMAIDRIYDNKKARVELGWSPKFNFRYILECLKEEKDFRSALARSVGTKGYHSNKFDDGPYPVNE